MHCRKRTLPMADTPHLHPPVQFRLRDVLIATAAASIMAALLGPYLRTADVPFAEKVWAVLIAVGIGALWLPAWAIMSRIGAGDPLLEARVDRPLAWRWMMSDLLVSPLWGALAVFEYGVSSLEPSLAGPMLLLYAASYLLTGALMVSCLWRRYECVMVTTKGLLLNAHCFVGWDDIELPEELASAPARTLDLTINTTFRRGRIALVNSPGLVERLRDAYDSHATLYRGETDRTQSIRASDDDGGTDASSQ